VTFGAGWFPHLLARRKLGSPSIDLALPEAPSQRVSTPRFQRLRSAWPNFPIWSWWLTAAFHSPSTAARFRTPREGVNAPGLLFRYDLDRFGNPFGLKLTASRAFASRGRVVASNPLLPMLPKLLAFPFASATRPGCCLSALPCPARTHSTKVLALQLVLQFARFSFAPRPDWFLCRPDRRSRFASNRLTHRSINLLEPREVWIAFTLL